MTYATIDFFRINVQLLFFYYVFPHSKYFENETNNK